MAVKGSSLSSIKRIHSHEQGIAQCRNNIIKLDKKMVIEADTAGSAKLVAELNNTEELSKNVISLPIHTELENSNQDYIIDRVLGKPEPKEDDEQQK